MTRTKRVSVLAVFSGVLCVLSQSVQATEEFHAYLAPDSVVVARGAVAEVAFEVDQTAHQFNGYDVTIQFDPDVVSLESIQVGDLIIESCDNWFTHFEETDSTVTISHIILCDLVSMDGPGTLSIINFNADNLGYSPLTFISHPDSSFFDAGLYVWPGHVLYPRQVILHDGGIHVLDGSSPIAEESVLSSFGLEHPAPNPLTARTCIAYVLPRTEYVRLLVLDAQGRVVRRLVEGERPAGRRQITWDGANEVGRPVASGSYYIKLDRPEGVEQRPIVVLR